MLTKKTIDLILINGILPFIFFYAQKNQDVRMTDSVITLYKSLSPENNKIIRKWKKVGISAESGFDSQSLLHLYKFYCKKKKCLQCGIGHELLTDKE